MEEVYNYKGHRVRVSAVPKDAAKEIWNILVFIDGSQHLRSPFGDARRGFSSPGSAIAHGKEAAQCFIDEPLKSKEQL
jgi:hypothetical protein